MLKLGTDGILSMSTLPLRIALWLGMALSSLSFAYLVYIIWAFFFTNRAIVGWSSLIVAILFLGGLQINILGIIGLYIAKTYEETKQRPIYIVREKVGRLA
jgi:dolichol-phosphate mannosyltransferase